MILLETQVKLGMSLPQSFKRPTLTRRKNSFRVFQNRRYLLNDVPIFQKNSKHFDFELRKCPVSILVSVTSFVHLIFFPAIFHLLLVRLQTESYKIKLSFVGIPTNQWVFFLILWGVRFYRSNYIFVFLDVRIYSEQV